MRAALLPLAFFLGLIAYHSNSQASIEVQNVGTPGLEETFQTVFKATDDEDIHLTGFSNNFKNEMFEPSQFSLSDYIDSRFEMTQFTMRLFGQSKLDFLLLSNGANRAVLAEMVPDPNVKIIEVRAYLIRTIRIAFNRPRKRLGVPVMETKFQGLKSVTFKTATGFVFTMDLDPDHELYRHLALVSGTPLKID